MDYQSLPKWYHYIHVFAKGGVQRWENHIPSWPIDVEIKVTKQKYKLGMLLYFRLFCHLRMFQPNKIPAVITYFVEEAFVCRGYDMAIRLLRGGRIDGYPTRAT